MSSTKIFQNPYSSTETWSSQGAVITWYTGSNGGADAAAMVPLLASAIQISYQRRLSPFYPLNQKQGSLKKCVIAGAPTGNLTISSIYAPTSSDMTTFLAAVSKSCKTDADQVTIIIHPYGTSPCKTGAYDYQDQSFKLTGVDLESLGLSMQGGEAAYTTMPLTFSFSDLTYYTAD